MTEPLTEDDVRRIIYEEATRPVAQGEKAKDWTVSIEGPTVLESFPRHRCWETNLLGVGREIRVRIDERPRLIVRIFHRLCFGLRWREVRIPEKP